MQHFKQIKVLPVPDFCFLSNRKPQPYHNVPYLSIFNKIRPRSYLILPFQIDLSRKVLIVTKFCFLNSTRPQPYLNRTLFQHFQQYQIPAALQSYLFQHFPQYKAPAVPDFSIFNRIKPQQYFTSVFQHFQQNKAPAVPYFSIFNKRNPRRTLFWFFQ